MPRERRGGSDGNSGAFASGEVIFLLEVDGAREDVAAESAGDEGGPGVAFEFGYFGWVVSEGDEEACGGVCGCGRCFDGREELVEVFLSRHQSARGLSK